MARKRRKILDVYGPPGSYVEVGAHQLLDRLLTLGRILPRATKAREVEPAEAAFLVAASADGTATASAADAKARVGLQFKLDVYRRSGQGMALIAAEALIDLVKVFPEPRLCIHLDDAENVAVTGRNCRYVLRGYDPKTDLVAEADPSLTRSGWVFAGDGLAAAIGRTRKFVDIESTRYALGGIAFFFPDPKGGLAEVVATDGGRLSLYRVPVQPAGKDPARSMRDGAKGPDGKDDPRPPILHASLLGIVAKLGREAGAEAIGVTLIPGEGTIQVVTRDAVLTAPSVEGRFPKFREVFPEGTPEAEVRLEHADRLADLVRSVETATDDVYPGVDLAVADGLLMLTAESEERGRATASLPVPDSNGRSAARVHAEKFREVLAAAGSGPIRLRLYGPKTQMVLQAGPCHEVVFMPTEGGGYKPPAKPAPEDEPAPAVEPEPVAPVAASPAAHKGNGRARPKK